MITRRFSTIIVVITQIRVCNIFGSERGYAAGVNPNGLVETNSVSQFKASCQILYECKSQLYSPLCNMIQFIVYTNMNTAVPPRFFRGE